MTTRILALSAIFAMATITSGIFSNAFAGELDNGAVQAALAKNLPGTVVVRVNEKGEASVLETSEKLAQDKKTISALHSANFKSLEAQSGTAELDRESGAASWFAYYPSYYGRGYAYFQPAYYAPVYYSYGYSYAYTNCYSYSYYGYNYYWYRW